MDKDNILLQEAYKKIIVEALSPTMRRQMNVAKPKSQDFQVGQEVIYTDGDGQEYWTVITSVQKDGTVGIAIKNTNPLFVRSAQYHIGTQLVVSKEELSLPEDGE